MFKMGFQPRTNLCKDSNGNLVAGEQQVWNMWAEYFKDLLNKGVEGEDQVNTVHFGPDPFIPFATISMVYDTTRKLKNNRATGEYLIKTALIKYAGRRSWKCIHNLIVDIWNSETMPNDSNITILCPFHEKGNKLESSNCWGISLLNVIYKTFTNILAKYIEPHVEQSFSESSPAYIETDPLQIIYLLFVWFTKSFINTISIYTNYMLILQG